MITSFARFLIGFGMFFRGVRLLARAPKLWPFAIAPFLIGTAVLIAGMVWAFGNVGPMISAWAVGIEAAPEFLRSALHWAVLLLMWPIALVAVLYGSYILTKVIGSPFHALLAERALIALGDIEDKPFQMIPWLRVSARMLLVSLLKTLLFAVLGATLFVATWIPIVNIFAAFGFLLIVSFDCVDYSFEAKQMGFRGRLRYFRDNLPYFCGFAVSLGLVFFIPGFNFFLFPAAVTGGSELFHRIETDSVVNKSAGRIPR